MPFIGSSMKGFFISLEYEQALACRMANKESHRTSDHGLLVRALIGHLEVLLGDLGGPKAPERFFQAIGCSFGALGEISYRRKQDALSPAHYAEAIVDLTHQLSGEVHYQLAPDQVTFFYTKCPFGEAVKQEPSLCHFTSGILGWTAARNFGYAKVILRKRIALGDEHCDIGIYLKKIPEAEAEEGTVYPSLTNLSADLIRGVETSMEEIVQQLKARTCFLERRVVELEEALQERGLIEKAKGVLMERLKLTEAEAMRRLQKESQDRNKKLAEIARIIVQAGEII